MTGKSRRTKRRRTRLLLVLATLGAAFAAASVAGAMPLSGGAATPTIASDQADYTPGATVTLTGSGWQGDTSVALFVNDSVGSTWSWSDTVQPDGNGNISDTLVLPNSFIATYSVSATGSPSGSVATTTFTDKANTTNAVSASANPTVSGTGVTFTATISGSFGTPTGQVDFKDTSAGTTLCSNVALSGGQATCSTSALPLGTNAIQAHYGGNGVYNAGNANMLEFVDPRPATSLVATANGNSRIDLTWGASPDAPNITDYVISRDGTALATHPANSATSFSDTGLTSGTKYCYTVFARYNDGTTDFFSTASNQSCATTASLNSPPTTPGAPSVASGTSPRADGNFTVNWTASTDPDAGDTVTYTLEQHNASTGTFSVVASGLTTNSYSFGAGGNPVEGEGTWSFRVKAVDNHSAASSYAESDNLVKVDETNPNAPTASPTPASPDFTTGGGDKWYKDSVVVKFASAGDPNLADGSAGSGVASVSGGSTGFMFDSSNANATTGAFSKSGTATDNAGNTSSPTTLSGFVDWQAPTVTVTATTTPVYTDGSGNDWWKDSVSLHVAASDPAPSSGLATDPTTNLGPFTASGTIAASAYTATDNVGHSGSNDAFSYHVDAAAPVGGAVSVTAGYNTTGNVHVAVTDATDSDSGVATQTLERKLVTLAGGTCGDFTAVAWQATTLSSSDNSVSGGNCVEYRLVATDNVGHTATFGPSDVVKVDTTGPTITFTGQTPSANGNLAGNGIGWNNSAVTLNWTCSDAESGVVDGSISQTVSTEGYNQKATGTCTNGAGVDATDDEYVNIDKHAPAAPTGNTTPATPDYTAGDGTKWFNDSVTVSFTGNGDPDLADGHAGSGVASVTGPATFNTAGPFSQTGYATDNADNTSGATTVSGSVDTADPSSSASAVLNGTSTVYASGDWTNKSVDVTLTGSDPGAGSGLGSGLKEIDYSVNGGAVQTAASGHVVPFTTEGVYTITFHAVDNVGHAESPSNTFTVKIDKSNPNAPTVTSPTAADYTAGDGTKWYKDSVTVSFTGNGDPDLADGHAGSGVASVTDPTTYSTAGPFSKTGYATDNADNTSAGTTVSGAVDTAAPSSSASAVLTSTTTTYHSGDWTNHGVTVTLTGDDGSGSGVKQIVYSINGGADQVAPSASVDVAFPQTTADGVYAISYHAVDNVGHAESPSNTFTVKIDKGAPNAPTASTNPATPNYTAGDGTKWYKDSVTVSFTGNGDPDLADGHAGSGVASVTGSTTYNTAGSFSKTGYATDNAGNQSDGITVTGKVDTAAPTFGNCAGGPFMLNSGTQSVSITAQDEAGGSGLDNAGSTLTGTVDTSTLGKHTVTFTAKDNVGHSNTKSCDYYVNYKFIGFLSPLNSDQTGTVLNIGNAGKTYPIKWQLTDGATPPNYITDAVANTQVGVVKISCASVATDTGDPIDATTTGNTSLRYDSTANQYIYNWQTPSTKNTCYRLTVTTPDGQPHVAVFQMR